MSYNGTMGNLSYIHPELRGLAIEVSKLTPDPKNARKHDRRNLDAIKASLTKFGMRQPIVVQRAGDALIVRAGNGRMQVAKELGWSHLPAVVFDENDTDAVAYAIADNRTAELAEWDWDVLTEHLMSQQELGEDLGLLGFDADLLNEIGVNVEKSSRVEVVDDDDVVPDPPVDPITQRGDLWILGDHRLLCGDSTNPDDVARLMNGDKADLCFTSPPYALGRSVALSGNKSMSAKANPYGDHNDNAAEWDHLMRGWFAASTAAVGSVWVVNLQLLAGNKRDLVRFIADNAERLVDVVTWDKGHAAPAMAGGVMSSRFEWLIVFAANAGASRAVPLSSWRGTVQNVYAAPPQRGNDFSELHAATMPLHVPVWVMQTLCDQSTSVYEPFCGTGTTLIAAEQLGRKCYGMEISPRYCDVIVGRWEKLTGKTAVRG